MTGAPEAGDVPVGLSDLPALLDVHEHTPREWRHRSVLPDPDGQIGRSPWWWRTRILLWWHDRHA